VLGVGEPPPWVNRAAACLRFFGGADELPARRAGSVSPVGDADGGVFDDDDDARGEHQPLLTAARMQGAGGRSRDV